jgi:hypothetical protein
MQVKRKGHKRKRVNPAYAGFVREIGTNLLIAEALKDASPEEKVQIASLIPGALSFIRLLRNNPRIRRTIRRIYQRTYCAINRGQLMRRRRRRAINKEAA